MGDVGVTDQEHRPSPLPDLRQTSPPLSRCPRGRERGDDNDERPGGLGSPPLLTAMTGAGGKDKSGRRGAPLPLAFRGPGTLARALQR